MRENVPIGYQSSKRSLLPLSSDVFKLRNHRITRAWALARHVAGNLAHLAL